MALKDAFVSQEMSGHLSRVPVTAMITAVVLIPLAIVLAKLLLPVYDRREPPVMPSTVPFFGHVVSMLRESSDFYQRLYKKKPLAIYTLPVLHGKLYVANSPGLIAAAMRHSDISFYPIQIEATTGIVGLPPHLVEVLGRTSVFQQIKKLMATSLMKEPLRETKSAALAHCSEVLNSIKPQTPLETADGWGWIQATMAMAAAKALYGRNNMWDVERFEDMILDDSLGLLAINVVPKLLASTALAARKRMRALLLPFYAQRQDENPDVARIIRDRARYFRRRGASPEEIASMEIIITWAATTNTVPVMFWIFAHVFSKTDYVERIRQEMLPLVAVARDEGGNQTATVDASSIEAVCPFLMACYRETLRLYVAMTTNRRVMKDAILEDMDGQQWLLKKGTGLQWATSVVHYLPEAWGEDAASFRPERFLNVSPKEERRRRGAMIPFGGGRHLCPGRQFAQMEITGLVGVLALGFDVDGVEVPRSEAPPLGPSVRRPVRQSRDDIRISRRKEWEHVNWKFAC
ncbi:7-alpha-hydroxycholest-4-en-3-one 12-alpha-hydroxylase [Colletotrichum sidae]|uniref:7-alpha-hydroxycholest-4-en-3-one 12-alpha-hydroxylase n=1 Tax=Colletotrichum sidae TaxID=1347389 RepID=A0A4R8TCB2_9PEZI|nr:7-alpha-hydroxycholest-4-en-3-one 12-alpha-hydroxylase [Colletotrichum sidae]